MAAESKEIAFVHHFEGHELKLMNNLSLQWKDRVCCDLVIAAQNGSLTVHACVLAAFSPKILSLLSEQQNKLGALNMTTIEVKFKYEVMEIIVAAVYTGFFQPPTKLLNEVLLASKWLKMKELTGTIKDFIDKPEHSNSSILAETSFKEVPQADFSLALNCSQAELCPDGSDSTTVKQQINDSSSNVNVETPAVNLNSSNCRQKSSRRKRNTAQRIPAADSANKNLNRKNEWVEIYFPNFYSNNMDITPENGAECGDIDNENKQITVMKTRSSRTVKRRGRQPAEVVQPKRRKERSKLSDRTDSRRKTSQKSSKRKVKESNADSKSSKLYKKESVILAQNDQVKTESEVLHSLQLPVKDEVHSDDPDKEKQSLVLDTAVVIKCKKCYAKFTSVDLYHSHVEDHPTFECEQCHQLFLSKFTLNKHVRSIHFGHEYLICRHCDFSARSQVELRKHAASVHDDIKPFPCSYTGCTFSAVKHSQVLKHMIIHSEEKVFRCHKCDRTFLRETGLESHQKACFQLQEFLCDLCGQSFNHIHSMRKHRRAIHFGEKPYKCSVCSNSFGDHRNLHRHMLIHENSFPYSCPVCRQQFRHSNSLKAHVAAKHKDQPEKVVLNFSNGSLGGASYKRVLKNDPINPKASRIAKDGGRAVKRWSYKVKREVLSPSEMFGSTAFPGEFLIHAEDGSSSNDLELGVEGVRHIDGFTYTSKNEHLNRVIIEGDNRGVIEGDNRDISSCDNTSGYQLRPPGPSLGWTEKSPQHVPPGPPSLGQSDIQTLSVPPGPPSLGQSDIQTFSVSPHKNSVPIVNISDFIEAHSNRTLPVPELPAYHLSNSQLGAQKLQQQTSQQALEKFLSQNRIGVGKSKLVSLPKIFKASNTMDPKPSSHPSQTAKPAALPTSLKTTGLWKETSLEQISPGGPQKCFSDFTCYDEGGQLPPGVSISQSAGSLSLLKGKNVTLVEHGSVGIDKLT